LRALINRIRLACSEYTTNDTLLDLEKPIRRNQSGETNRRETNPQAAKLVLAVQATFSIHTYRTSVTVEARTKLTSCFGLPMNPFEKL
jgi:hypothetical protein